MTITVNKPENKPGNKPEKANVRENDKTEYKSSVFFAPGEKLPGFKQMREIAASIAAFMNADGGNLYVGIADRSAPCWQAVLPHRSCFPVRMLCKYK